MNLALTYASRTHHLRLARQISELIQIKAMNLSSDEDNEDYLLDDNIEEDAIMKDSEYAKDRSEKLKRSVRPLSKTAVSSRKMTFSKYSTNSTKYQTKDNDVEINETKELFSDQSDTEVDVPVERTESDVESVGDSPTHTTPYSSGTRFNPFKVMR